jgi:hypothetical protein
MLENILQEQILTHDYYNEYLNTIKRYENITRTAVFIRYLNINKNISIFNDDTLGTDTKFESGIYFDSYDYTPVIQFDQNVNSPAERNDLSGFKYDGLTSITIYTIVEPNIGDLVLFPYPPYQAETIFRINNISTSLEVRNNSIYTYKLGLEYAPLKTIGNIKIANKYAYLISKEKNVLVDEYIQIVNKVKNITEYLKNLQAFFNDKYELYYYIIGNYIIAPININEKIYNYLCHEINLDRYYDRFKKPFGIFNKTSISSLGIDITTGNFIKVADSGLPYIDSNGKLVLFYDSQNYDILNYSNSVTPLEISLLQFESLI